MPRSERLRIPNADGPALAARLDLPEHGEPAAYTSAPSWRPAPP